MSCACAGRSRGAGVTGHSLTSRAGDVHKRQRKVMLPAFGSSESKALLPVFRHYAEQVSRALSTMVSFGHRY